MSEETLKWLLSVGGPLGFFCAMLIGALGVVYRDNMRLRSKVDAVQESRVSDSRELIKGYGEFARTIQGMTDQLRVFLEELRNNNRSRR